MRRLLRATPLLVLLALIGMVATPATPSADAIGEPTFTNPLLPDSADPWLEYWEGNYYLIATTWSNRVEVRKSPTLAGLRSAEPVVVWADTTPGRNANMWAPDLHRLRSPDGSFRWYLMYTMGTAGNFGQQHLQVLESAGDDPMGPYSYKGRPVPTDDFNIDGSYVELAGRLYLTWSQFAPDGLQSNYIALMSTPWTTTGPLNILSQPTEAWERIGMPVNEAPVQLSRGGREYIVYSASFCGTPDYQLATLEWTGGDPLNRASWIKSAGPVFSRANGAFGTGHNGFFTSPDGTQIWNVYHANPTDNGGCSRQRTARAQPVSFDGANRPNFGVPVAAGTPVTVPSGERGPLSPAAKGAAYQLVNRNSGLCAVVSGGSVSDGGDVRQAACTTGGASTWVLDPTADGWHRLVNSASRKVLDSADCGTADGTDARQWAWLANTCQQWRIDSAVAGYSTLTNRANGKVLDATSCATAAGSDVRQWRPLGNACQQWLLRPVGAVAITSIETGKSFDLPGCTTAAGAALQQWQWLGSPCQRVTVTSTTDGYLQLRPATAPSLCLGVRGGSSADGAVVEQAGCSATSTQWRLVHRQQGGVELIARHSGKALDLASCGQADGTALAQWTALGNRCQAFRVAS